MSRKIKLKNICNTPDLTKSLKSDLKYQQGNRALNSQLDILMDLARNKYPKTEFTSVLFAIKYTSVIKVKSQIEAHFYSMRS